MAAQGVREATAANLEQRMQQHQREKEAEPALTAKVRRELLMEAPYHLGDEWVEAFEELQLSRLERTNEGDGSSGSATHAERASFWSATGLRVFHCDDVNSYIGAYDGHHDALAEQEEVPRAAYAEI
eukprot:4045944-Prymnesium_polylepis.1